MYGYETDQILFIPSTHSFRSSPFYYIPISHPLSAVQLIEFAADG